MISLIMILLRQPLGLASDLETALLKLWNILVIIFIYLKTKINKNISITKEVIALILRKVKSEGIIFASLKAICFTILVLSALSLTSDYLSYPYIYKLIVSDNKLRWNRFSSLFNSVLIQF